MSELIKFTALNQGDEFYVWKEKKNEPEIVRLKKLPPDTYLSVGGMLRKANAIRMCDAVHVLVEEDLRVVLLYLGWSRNNDSSPLITTIESKKQQKGGPVPPPYAIL